MILKASKKVYEVIFFDVEKYVYSESVFITLLYTYTYTDIKRKC